MRKIKLLLVVVISIFLHGCATGAKMENMVYNGSGVNYEEALKKQIALASVSGGESTNPAWTSEIGNDEFSGAVKTSLANQGLLSESGRYQLRVNLLKVDQPLVGFDMTVTTHVSYTLTDSKNNSVIFTKTVVTPFTATVGDAFAAVKRLRLANEGAGKKNIEGLLDELSKLKIQPQEVSLIN